MTSIPFFRNFERTHAERQRLQRSLTFAVIVFGYVWVMAHPFISPYPALDYNTFRRVGLGTDFAGYYYAPWLMPFFTLIAQLPYDLGLAISNAVSLSGYLLALHVFKGNRLLLVTSYSLFIAISYGQVDGIFVGMLTLMYLALRRGWIVPAAVCWFIASAKFYSGIPLGLGLLWYYADKRQWAQAVVVMGVLGLGSLLVYPDWIPDLLQRMRELPPHDTYTIDLWSYLGPIVLLFWVPVLLSRKKDYRWFVAAWMLTSPYLHIHALLYMLVFPVGWIGWIVQVNYLTGLTVALYLMIVPAYVYLMSWRASWQTDWLSVWLARRRGIQEVPPPPSQEAPRLWGQQTA